MQKKKLIVYGFGILMLSMAVTQFLTLGYFNHVLRDYLLPMGDGAKLLSFLVFPVSILLICMEGLCAAAILAMNRDNPLRENFIKLGVAAAVIWFILICSALLRGVPGFAGFFGEKLRQPRGWPILLESGLIVAWGFYALKYHDDI